MLDHLNHARRGVLPIEAAKLLIEGRVLMLEVSGLTEKSLGRHRKELRQVSGGVLAQHGWCLRFELGHQALATLFELVAPRIRLRNGRIPRHKRAYGRKLILERELVAQ